MHVYGTCLFVVCCSDGVGFCVNVCCVVAVVKNSVFSLGFRMYSYRHNQRKLNRLYQCQSKILFITILGHCLTTYPNIFLYIMFM